VARAAAGERHPARQRLLRRRDLRPRRPGDAQPLAAGGDRLPRLLRAGAVDRGGDAGDRAARGNRDPGDPRAAGGAGRSSTRDSALNGRRRDRPLLPCADAIRQQRSPAALSGPGRGAPANRGPSARVSRAVAGWRRRASAIPDAALRRAALTALNTKRGHTDGAALFAALPRARDRTLLDLLVAYELIWDYLDTVHEAAPTESNGRRLHLALVDALDPRRPLSDWYEHHTARDDGGYLRDLVEACRRGCTSLPSFSLVQELLATEAWRAQVLALNHLTDLEERDAALRAWAREEFPGEEPLAWFELSGAASASLVVHALLAVAADPAARAADAIEVRDAYWPWISLATTMLDSWVDRTEDDANGDHSYVAHYPDERRALERIEESLVESAARARRLPNGHRHAIVVAGMTAMYLTKDSVRTREPDRTTRRLLAAGGTLPRLLHPILRIWRLRYGQRAA
jgi:tetraprenyl-beta-curcumene synthase